MKQLKFLMIAIIAISMSACEENVPADEEIIVKDGTYKGTLIVDQNDGTSHTQENVSVIFESEENGATIKMLQVSFSPKMPVKLDMTIPKVVTASITEGLSLSGDNIIPLAMGGEFPQYTITEMTGQATPQTISFEMMCGTYPLTFSGTIVE